MEINNLKISIVIVCYNAAATIERTIQSVVWQDYPNIELIIIDGNSNDGTLQIIDNYRNFVSVFISERDTGPYDAMNKSLCCATGDFLIFLGTDDVFCSSHVISKVVSKISNLDAVYYGNSYFDQIDYIWRGKFNKIKLACTNINHQSIFYPRSVYQSNKYDLRFKLLADWYYNIILYKNTQFIFLGQLISIYSCGGISNRIYDHSFYKILNKTIRENLGVFPLICRQFFRIYRKMKKILFGSYI